MVWFNRHVRHSAGLLPEQPHEILLLPANDLGFRAINLRDCAARSPASACRDAVLAPVVKRASADDGDRQGHPPFIGAQVLWRPRPIAGTARPRRANIFAIHASRLNYVPCCTQRRCAMWRLSDAQALIFIAAVAIAVALLLLWLA
jgi:hypothetical protein